MNQEDKDELGELCVRCGDRGQDRRTLWHACMYEMNELNVGFQRKQIFRVNDPDVITEIEEVPYRSVSSRLGESDEVREGFFKETKYKIVKDTNADFLNFYLLRVCKDCRGSWLRAIERWFNNRSG